jgi:hypothetical protein
MSDLPKPTQAGQRTGIRLTKEERKALLAQLERRTSRTVPPERVLQRGEQALKDGHLDQARRILKQLEAASPGLAGLGHFRGELQAAERDVKRRSNLQATEEMLTRYIQQRKKPLAELALATLIEIAPHHPRRAEYQTWVADLDQELALEGKIQQQFDGGRAALRRGDLAAARKHLEALRKLDPDSPAAQQLAADLADVTQGRALSADIERVKARLEELLAAGRLDEAEREMSQLGAMDVPKVTVDFLRKRLEDHRRQIRDREEAGQLVSVFERHLAAHDWPNAREVAHRFGQRFPGSPQGAELFKRINDLEATQRRQQSLDEGLAVLEGFIAKGNRHDAELALKLLSRLDLEPERLAQLEARVRAL